MTNSEFMNNTLSPASTLIKLNNELRGFKLIAATSATTEERHEADYEVSKIQRQIEQTERLQSDIASGTY